MLRLKVCIIVLFAIIKLNQDFITLRHRLSIEAITYYSYLACFKSSKRNSTVIISLI